MKPVEAILGAALLAGLAGCAARAKQPVIAAVPAVPTPPPPPLSIPQTQVQLPPSQALDPDAFATAQPALAPPPATPPPVVNKPPQTTRHNLTAQPKPDLAPPAEAARQPIQEILPPNLQQKYKRTAEKNRRQALQLMTQAQGRTLTADEQALITRINQYVKSSSDAEANGDLRSADELAGRAYILAKDLQSGK